MKIENIIKAKKPISLTKQTVVNIIYSGIYVSHRLNKALKIHDITLQQFNVLRILRGQNGNSLSLNEIQDRMINSNSNTTRLIDKLVTKEYVKRTIDSNNRRKVSISISKIGLNFINQLDKCIDNDEEEKIVSNLSKEECELLNTLLEKIRV